MDGQGRLVKKSKWGFETITYVPVHCRLLKCCPSLTWTSFLLWKSQAEIENWGHSFKYKCSNEGRWITIVTLPVVLPQNLVSSGRSFKSKLQFWKNNLLILCCLACFNNSIQATTALNRKVFQLEKTLRYIQGEETSQFCAFINFQTFKIMEDCMWSRIFPYAY